MRKTSLITFVSFAMGIIASIVGNASCSDSGHTAIVRADTLRPATSQDPATSELTKKQMSWDKLDWNAPELRYEEIKAHEQQVRGNEHFGIYSLGENILFAEGKSEIRLEAMDNLNQVIASIKQRYPDGEVRIYGFTDTTASTETNKVLSADRANAVKKYMVAAGIPEDHISVFAEGEADPVASNNTASGRALNRRVKIVAMKD